MTLSDQLDRLTHITTEDRAERLGWIYARTLYAFTQYEKWVMETLTKAQHES